MADSPPPALNQEDGLIYARVLDGKGSLRPLDWAGVRGWWNGEGPLWVHLDLGSAKAREWVRREAKLDAWAVDALLTSATRPRADEHAGGVIAVFRGVNLNPGAAPDDMIAVRIWMDADRIITIRAQVMQSIRAVREALEAGTGPTTIAAMAQLLLRELADRTRAVVDELEETMDDLDESEESARIVTERLGEVRRRSMRMRMHLRPQQEAIEAFAEAEVAWLTDDDRAALHQIAHRFARLIDDVEAVREEAAMLDGELRAEREERLNSRLYLLAIVSAVFLPLSFLTGLLGANVGGNPLEGWAGGMLISIILCAGVGVGVLALLRRMDWF